MSSHDKNVSSDRAATHCAIGIADGIFGNELAVEATEDGLEFGDGYSTLSWDWILRALSTVRLDDAESLALGHDIHIGSREGEAPS